MYDLFEALSENDRDDFWVYVKIYLNVKDKWYKL